MLDGRKDRNVDEEDDWLLRAQDRCELCCVSVARCFKVEDLALSVVVSGENQLVDMEDVTTLKLRKEMQQLLRVTRGAGFYFMFLSLVYLFQSTVSYNHLNLESFQKDYRDQTYAAEIYSLIEAVCWVNIVHALTMISLAGFLILFTRRFTILNERHYWQLALLTILITVVYFLPVVFVSYRAYADATAAEGTTTQYGGKPKGAMTRFFDIMFYVMLRSAMGLPGFILTCIIQVQLYALVFVMMWCAAHVKDICDKVQKLKEDQAGTYDGLEMLGVEGADDDKSIEVAADLSAEQIALAEDQQALQEEEQLTGDLLDDKL